VRANVTQLSVVIPTYNRVTRLRACLDALGRQTVPATDFEVIVVNDGSSDATAVMLDQLTTPYALKVLHQSNQGQQIARNHGAAHAEGAVLLFIDDDIIAEPMLVAEHLKLHRERESVVGIGRMTLEVDQPDWYTARFAEDWEAHYRSLGDGRVPSWTDAYGGNISVSRETFSQVDGFARDIRRSHDIEFGYRLQQQGLTFVYLPDAVGRQVEHKRARQLLSDATKAGIAYVELCRRHPAMLTHLLGPMGDTSAREVLLRELCWRLSLAPWMLAKFGRLFPRTSWGDKWYRFVRSLGYWCGVRSVIVDRDAWSRSVGSVPILMYHAFGRSGERTNRFVVPIERFDRQVRWLIRNGYQIISLEEYLDCRRRLVSPPARSVVITIDDGYRDVATLAYPVLRQHGATATVFVVSDRVGKTNDWADDESLGGRPLMTWDEIEMLVADELRIGVHSASHRRLPELSDDDLQVEIRDSKIRLEKALRKSMDVFAYPYGIFDEHVVRHVEATGYAGACSAESGPNTWSTPLFSLRRTEVEGTWSMFQFALVVRFGGRVL
jgi:glycosyltransferase involved in cell wall biosynthesis